MKSKVDTVAIQDAMRERIAEALVAEVRRQTDGDWPVEFQANTSCLVDADLDFTELADAILALEPIEAGLALYLGSIGSIEEREPS